MKGQVIELATHDITIQRAMRRGFIEAAFFPLEVGISLWFETVADIQRFQREAMYLCYPWLRR